MQSIMDRRMPFHTALMVLLLAVITMLCAGSASAQSSSSSSSSTCTSALISLSPCLNYITGNETKPSSSCCSQLGQVVQSEAQCLCMVLDGAAASSLGITVNQTQALALPGACHVQTPPVSKCNNTNDNGGSTTPTTPSSSNAPSSSSANVPSGPAGNTPRALPKVDTSDGTLTGASIPFIFSLVFAMAFLHTKP